MNALAEERNKWLERYNVALVSVFSVGLVIQHTRSSFLRFWVSYIFLLSVVYGPLTIIIHSAWCLRLRANGCNNSQQCWDLQCIVGRIQPISLCKPCVMSVRGPSNVGRAVQTDPTLLRHASAITEQKKCWEFLAEKFDRFQTLRNKQQRGVQTDATCNIQQCWELLVNNFASICTQPKEWSAPNW